MLWGCVWKFLLLTPKQERKSEYKNREQTNVCSLVIHGDSLSGGLCSLFQKRRFYWLSAARIRISTFSKSCPVPLLRIGHLALQTHQLYAVSCSVLLPVPVSRSGHLSAAASLVEWRHNEPVTQRWYHQYRL